MAPREMKGLLEPPGAQALLGLQGRPDGRVLKERSEAQGLKEGRALPEYLALRVRPEQRELKVLPE